MNGEHVLDSLASLNRNKNMQKKDLSSAKLMVFQPKLSELIDIRQTSKTLEAVTQNNAIINNKINNA
jgi:hypothetical protein